MDDQLASKTIGGSDRWCVNDIAEALAHLPLLRDARLERILEIFPAAARLRIDITVRRHEGQVVWFGPKRNLATASEGVHARLGLECETDDRGNGRVGGLVGCAREKLDAAQALDREDVRSESELAPAFLSRSLHGSILAACLQGLRTRTTRLLPRRSASK